MSGRSRAKQREEKRRIIWEHLSNSVCKDCGEDDPIILEYDHIGEKNFTIGETVCSEDALRKEIALCEVVCANCHRRRTYVRANSYRFRWSEDAVNYYTDPVLEEDEK